MNHSTTRQRAWLQLALTSLVSLTVQTALAQRTLDQLPPAKVTREELSQPCADSKLESDENSSSGTVQRLMMWANEHIPRNRYSRSMNLAVRGDRGCTDFGFIVKQWQRANGKPETGRLTAAEVAELEDAFNDASRRTIQLREGQTHCRESALQIFGLPMGCALPPAFPKCAFDWNPASARTSCIEVVVDMSSGRHFAKALRFSRNEQPEWVAGNVELLMLGEELHGLRLRTSNQATAVSTVTSRLGDPEVTENRSRDAPGPVFLVDGVRVQTEGLERVRTSWRWTREELQATLSTDNPELLITTARYSNSQRQNDKREPGDRQAPRGRQF